jgi:hypothetical protein
MWVDGEQVWPSGINASQNKRGTNVTLVPATGNPYTVSTWAFKCVRTRTGRAVV